MRYLLRSLLEAGGALPCCCKASRPLMRSFQAGSCESALALARAEEESDCAKAERLIFFILSYPYLYSSHQELVSLPSFRSYPNHPNPLFR